jgi:hypothetical protein
MFPQLLFFPGDGLQARWQGCSAGEPLPDAGQHVPRRQVWRNLRRPAAHTRKGDRRKIFLERYQDRRTAGQHDIDRIVHAL